MRQYPTYLSPRVVEGLAYHEPWRRLDVVFLENQKRFLNEPDAQAFLIGKFRSFLSKRRHTGSVIFLGDEASDPAPFHAEPGRLDDAEAVDVIKQTLPLEVFISKYNAAHPDGPRVRALLGPRLYSANAMENALLLKSGKHTTTGNGNVGFRLGVAANRYSLEGLQYCFVAAKNLAAVPEQGPTTVFINDSLHGARCVRLERDAGWMRWAEAPLRLRQLERGPVRYHVLQM